VHIYLLERWLSQLALEVLGELLPLGKMVLALKYIDFLPLVEEPEETVITQKLVLLVARGEVALTAQVSQMLVDQQVFQRMAIQEVRDQQPTEYVVEAAVLGQ
jgi:hypothetical protein